MKDETEMLTDEIRDLGLSTGAELVGFASTEELERGSPKDHKPSSLVSDARSIVVLACGRNLNEDRDYVYKWGPNFALTYIKLKDEVGQRRTVARKSVEAIRSFLVEKGFKAVTEPHGWSGILSFKMAAYLAGLGVFGKGNFIVHPTIGPLNIVACILTDARLVYGTPLNIDVCGDCIECIRSCKYGAFRKEGRTFRWIGEKCRCYDLIMNPVTLKWTYGPCNSKCVNVCPIGR